jgi:hypothetical protein
MKAKGDAHYLEKQPEWLKEIVPNTTVSREYGIHRSALKIINYLHTSYKRYTEEVIHKETDENGNVIREIKGMAKILDPMLLEETIQYTEEGNFDRLVAAELAIVQAMKMDPIFGRVKEESDGRVKALYSHREKQILFASSRGVFNKRKGRIFT